MKRVNKSADPERNFDVIISKLSADEILDLDELRTVRGGDGDGNGSDPVIIPPPGTGD